jgi:biotin carboxylase
MIAKAREMGLFTVAVDGNPEAPGLMAADVAEVADICDPDEVTLLASQYRADGIYPAAEWCVEAAAIAADKTGLPGPSALAGMRARNKLAVREALDTAGIPNPAFQGVSSLDEATEVLNGGIGLPVIVKPIDGNASRGVSRVDHAEDLPLAYAKALKASRSKRVLIEAFVEGEEFNVDGLVFDGQYYPGGITGKERSDPPYRFDWGIYMPPLEDADTVALIETTAASALKAIEFATGTTHVEVILSETGPYIVEIAGRPGGGRIPTDLIPLSYGMDFMADSLRVALGEAPREERRFERGAAMYWIPSRSGVVAGVLGAEEARKMPGVEDVNLSLEVGERLGHVVDCVTRDKIGYVLASGDTAEAAIANAKAARDCCKIATQATVEIY